MSGEDWQRDVLRQLRGPQQPPAPEASPAAEAPGGPPAAAQPSSGHAPSGQPQSGQPVQPGPYAEPVPGRYVQPGPPPDSQADQGPYREPGPYDSRGPHAAEGRTQSAPAPAPYAEPARYNYPDAHAASGSQAAPAPAAPGRYAEPDPYGGPDAESGVQAAPGSYNSPGPHAASGSQAPAPAAPGPYREPGSYESAGPQAAVGSQPPGPHRPPGPVPYSASGPQATAGAGPSPEPGPQHTSGPGGGGPGAGVGPAGGPQPGPSPAPAPRLPQASPPATTRDYRPEHRPRHLPSPMPAPPVDPGAAAAGRRSRSGDSTTRRAGSSLKRLVTASAGREVEEVTRIAQAIQQPVTTGRQIAVTSIRGGAGKTTVAALLNLTYAHYRQDAVLAIEADPALGTLALRLGAESVRWTAADLADIVTPSMPFNDLTGYLVKAPEGGWLLPASRGRIGDRLDLADYRTLTTATRRHFGVTVIDCETLPAELARTALGTVHVRVLVAPATVAGVATARTVLDWLATVPPALPGTVVALTALAPDTAVDMAAAVRYLAETGVGVLTIPYDRHLAAGAAISTALLGRRTRLAAGHLAAELLDRATATGLRGRTRR